MGSVRRFTFEKIKVKPETIAFLTASGITDITTVQAINYLVDNLITSSLWNKFQAIYPFVGTTQQNQKFNLKDPRDLNNAFRLQFFNSATGTHTNNGYQSNGSSVYANTFFVPSVQSNWLSMGFTLSCGTNNIPSTNNTFEAGVEIIDAFSNYSIGVKRSGVNLNTFGFLGNINSNFDGGYIYINNVQDSRGILSVISIGNNNRKLLKNGSALISNNINTITNLLPNLPIFIGCLNNVNNPFGYSNQRVQLTAIHEAMTDGEVATWHGIVDLFETKMGRKTW